MPAAAFKRRYGPWALIAGASGIHPLGDVRRLAVDRIKDGTCIRRKPVFDVRIPYFFKNPSDQFLNVHISGCRDFAADNHQPH